MSRGTPLTSQDKAAIQAATQDPTLRKLAAATVDNPEAQTPELRRISLDLSSDLKKVLAEHVKGVEENSSQKSPIPLITNGAEGLYKGHLVISLSPSVYAITIPVNPTSENNPFLETLKKNGFAFQNASEQYEIIEAIVRHTKPGGSFGHNAWTTQKHFAARNVYLMDGRAGLVAPYKDCLSDLAEGRLSRHGQGHSLELKLAGMENRLLEQAVEKNGGLLDKANQRNEDMEILKDGIAQQPDRTQEELSFLKRIAEGEKHLGANQNLPFRIGTAWHVTGGAISVNDTLLGKGSLVGARAFTSQQQEDLQRLNGYRVYTGEEGATLQVLNRNTLNLGDERNALQILVADQAKTLRSIGERQVQELLARNDLNYAKQWFETMRQETPSPKRSWFLFF